MGIPPERQSLLRTSDGLLYEVEVKDPILARRGAGHGVLASFEGEVGTTIGEVSRAISRQLQESQANSAIIEFGLKISAEAGFIVSATPDGGTFKITLRYDAAASNLES